LIRRAATGLLLLLVAIYCADAVQAQIRSSGETCKVGQQAAPIGFWTWPANTHVQVYIRAVDFNAQQLPSLVLALQNWNLAAEQTGAGVKFEYQGNTVQQRACAGCLTIMRGKVFDQTARHATELRAFSAHDDQLITSAVILVDPVLTNSQAILNAMVHELGHNLGLLDCYTCKRRSTVMNQFSSLNVPNEMRQPTSCDIAQVRQVYQDLKTLVRASPKGREQAPVDEGEEPIEDDTPVVVPPPAASAERTSPAHRHPR
jgi:hypothetical protein